MSRRDLWTWLTVTVSEQVPWSASAYINPAGLSTCRVPGDPNIRINLLHDWSRLACRPCTSHILTCPSVTLHGSKWCMMLCQIFSLRLFCGVRSHEVDIRYHRVRFLLLFFLFVFFRGAGQKFEGMIQYRALASRIVTLMRNTKPDMSGRIVYA